MYNPNKLTYFLRQVGTPFLKIGRTHDLFRRMIVLQSGNPYELQCLSVVELDMENELHIKFKERRFQGEWFFFPDDDLFLIGDFVRSKGNSILLYEDYLYEYKQHRAELEEDD